MIHLNIESVLRREIVEVGKRMYQKNLVASNDGNISCRLSDTEILITPTGVCKGDMTEDQLLKIDLDGNIISGYMRATSEMKMHLMVYKERLDVKAVVHAHPQKATAFAVARIGFDKVTLPEAVFALGNIALTEYGTPSTVELPNAVKKHIVYADALLLANHGALTVGKTPMEAYFNMETLEHYAAISLYARQLGGEKCLDEAQTRELFRIRSEVFGKPNPYDSNAVIQTSQPMQLDLNNSQVKETIRELVLKELSKLQ